MYAAKDNNGLVRAHISHYWPIQPYVGRIKKRDILSVLSFNRLIDQYVSFSFLYTFFYNIVL